MRRAVALDLGFFCGGVRRHDAAVGHCLQALPCTTATVRSVSGLLPGSPYPNAPRRAGSVPWALRRPPIPHLALGAWRSTQIRSRRPLTKEAAPPCCLPSNHPPSPLPVAFLNSGTRQTERCRHRRRRLPYASFAAYAMPPPPLKPRFLAALGSLSCSPAPPPFLISVPSGPGVFKKHLWWRRR